MASAGDSYIVEVKSSHIDWGKFRNPTNREPIEGESYVKIPSDFARNHNIVRGSHFVAHFANGSPSIQIKASGNGPVQNGIQYAKQFEGVGSGACKAFTPWYQSCGIVAGDSIKVEFTSSKDILFTKI